MVMGASNACWCFCTFLKHNIWHYCEGMMSQIGFLSNCNPQINWADGIGKHIIISKALNALLGNWSIVLTMQRLIFGLVMCFVETRCPWPCMLGRHKDVWCSQGSIPGGNKMISSCSCQILRGQHCFTFKTIVLGAFKWSPHRLGCCYNTWQVLGWRHH